MYCLLASEAVQALDTTRFQGAMQRQQERCKQVEVFAQKREEET